MNNVSAYLDPEMIILLCFLIPLLMSVLSSRSLFFVCAGFAAYVFHCPLILPAFLAFLFSTGLCFFDHLAGAQCRRRVTQHLHENTLCERDEHFLKFDKFVFSYFSNRIPLYYLRSYWNFETARILSFYYFTRESEASSFHRWNLVCGAIWAICVSGAGYQLAAFCWQRVFVEKQDPKTFALLVVIMLILKKGLGNSDFVHRRFDFCSRQLEKKEV